MPLAVFVTIPQDQADKLAHFLLESKVCACVNIIPAVKSYFWWKGEVDTAAEAILMIKTKDELFLRLKEMILMR